MDADNRIPEEKIDSGIETAEHYRCGALKPVPDFKSVLRLYVAVFLLLLSVGFVVQTISLEIGVLVTQWGIILPAALWYWWRYGVDKTVFSRLRPLKIKYVPTIILLSASFWVLNMVIVAVMVTGLIKLGYDPPEVIKPLKSISDYLLYLALLSLSAGLCEEALFRGTIMPALEKRGMVPAIIYSSILFAFYHVSFTSLISTFMLGVVMAVIVIKTGSLWGGILYHMLNNFYATTYLYIVSRVDPSAEYEPVALIAFLPLLIIALVVVYSGLRLLQKQSPCEPLLKNRKSWLPRGWLNWPFIVSLGLFMLFALLQMALGFGLLQL